MSTTINDTHEFSTTINGEVKSGGSITTPVAITAGSDEVYETRTAIVNTAADDFNVVTLWQNGDAGVDDFDFLWMLADADCLVEFTIDRAGTPEYVVLKLLANVPFSLAADDMLGGILTDGSAETMDQIDQIRVKNDTTGASADTTVNVRLVLMT